jgi:hypothetical protein
MGLLGGNEHLNPDPLDLVERHVICPAVVKLGGARAFVRCHRLGLFKGTATLEVGRDPGRPECVAPELTLKTGLGGAAPDHLIGIDAVHWPVRQHPGSTGCGAEEGGLVAIAYTLPELAEQISRDPDVIFLSGILLLVAGLAITRAHNIWSGGWRVLVTVLGWLAILSGLIRMFFPMQLAALAAAMAQRPAGIITAAAVVLILGGFLSFKAYSRD